MRVPLEKRIKKRKQLEMARIQDVLVDFVASLEKPAVFHGGTAIWRVYNGKRFSDDLDFYFVWKDSSRIKRGLAALLEPHGIEMVKFKETPNTLFIGVRRGRTSVRLEFSKQHKRDYIVGSYERVDGTFTSIYVLSPEQLFKEKVSTFLSRFLVRDLYDLVFLRPLCDKRQVFRVVQQLQAGLKPPKDEKILKTLVVEGIAPNFDKMKKTIMRW